MSTEDSLDVREQIVRLLARAEGFDQPAAVHYTQADEIATEVLASLVEQLRQARQQVEMHMGHRMQIEDLLDEVIGTEPECGAGEGFVADVTLAIRRLQERLRADLETRTRERDDAASDYEAEKKAHVRSIQRLTAELDEARSHARVAQEEADRLAEEYARADREQVRRERDDLRSSLTAALSENQQWRSTVPSFAGDAIALLYPDMADEGEFVSDPNSKLLQPAPSLGATDSDVCLACGVRQSAVPGGCGDVGCGMPKSDRAAPVEADTHEPLADRLTDAAMTEAERIEQEAAHPALRLMREGIERSQADMAVPPTLAQTRTGTDWCPSCLTEVGTNRSPDTNGVERCATCWTELVAKPALRVWQDTAGVQWAEVEGKPDHVAALVDGVPKAFGEPPTRAKVEATYGPLTLIDHAPAAQTEPQDQDGRHEDL